MIKLGMEEFYKNFALRYIWLAQSGDEPLKGKAAPMLVYHLESHYCID